MCKLGVVLLDGVALHAAIRARDFSGNQRSCAARKLLEHCNFPILGLDLSAAKDSPPFVLAHTVALKQFRAVAGLLAISALLALAAAAVAQALAHASSLRARCRNSPLATPPKEHSAVQANPAPQTLRPARADKGGRVHRVRAVTGSPRINSAL